MVRSMPNYNFYDAFYAAPLRFQQFACAVLSVREKCVFQRFGEGRDGGIDGLYVSGDERIILQVKRTEVKGRALLSILRGERRKMRTGECSRYILVLSVRNISAEQKEEIRKLFPEIKSTNDIITGADLNGYLEMPEYAHIEKAYHELWLNSGNYLEMLLEKHMSAEILARSQFKMKLTEKEKKTFIATAAFAEALDILRAHQRVIISGEPGAGKTAHAVCLADYCVQIDGYEELYFVNSLEEIEQILGGGNGKKVILFDDFWGHGSFSESRIELNSERRIQELFRVLPRYPDIRLIFTTREFVLQQGLQHFPELEEISEINKITLRLGTYRLAQKAEILYRHLDAADLEYQYVEAIFQIRGEIICCEAYSPRSVAYFLENVPPENRTPIEYAAMMAQYVKAPNKYFESIFAQLSYGAKLICLLLLLSEEEIRIEPELKKEFMAVADACGDKVEKEQFTNYLRELEGAFTKVGTTFYSDKPVLDFLNHSIRDFVKEYLNSHIEAYEMLFAKNCIYFNQLIYMVSEINISDACRRILLDRMIDEMNKLKYSFVYSMDVDNYYSADAMTWEYEANKVWQLYVQCRRRFDQRGYQFLEAYCGKLLEGLYAKELDRPQMEALINLIPPMKDLGWEIDGRKLLEAYYDNINWTAELDLMDSLRPCCPEYYDKFVAEHLDETAERLPFLILQDIEYYLDERDGDARIDDLIDDAPRLFGQYGIKYTKSFERDMYEAAERELPAPRTDRMPKVIKEAASRYRVEQQNYEEVTKQAEEWFLPQIKYLSPRKIKETERAFGRDYRRGWLTKGEFTEEDFMLVMEYLETLPGVPRGEEEFYDGLTGFLTEQWDMSERRALQAAARKLMERNLFYFTEKEAARYSEIEKGLTEKMTDCGVARRTGRWYHFWNQKMILYLAAQSIREMSDVEKEAYYREDMWQYWTFAQESGWASYLEENDREALVKYLARPRFAEFLAGIPERGRRAREEWLMKEMEWEWYVSFGDGQNTDVLTFVSYSEATAVFDEIEWEITGDAYDTFEQAVVDGWDEGKLQRFGKEIHSHIEIHIQDLLSSATMRKFLREKGCFDAMGKILDTMKQYVDGDS